MKYSKGNHKMCPDGLEEEWGRVLELASAITNAELEDDSATAHVLRGRLRGLLDELQAKYGQVASILATRGEYADDPDEQLEWFHAAYARARDDSDMKNMALAASSIAETLVYGTRDREAAVRWIDELRKNWDAWKEWLEHDICDELTKEVRKLGQ